MIVTAIGVVDSRLVVCSLLPAPVWCVGPGRDVGKTLSALFRNPTAQSPLHPLRVRPTPASAGCARVLLSSRVLSVACVARCPGARSWLSASVVSPRARHSLLRVDLPPLSVRGNARGNEQRERRMSDSLATGVTLVRSPALPTSPTITSALSLAGRHASTHHSPPAAHPPARLSRSSGVESVDASRRHPLAHSSPCRPPRP